MLGVVVQGEAHLLIHFAREFLNFFTAAFLQVAVFYFHNGNERRGETFPLHQDKSIQYMAVAGPQKWSSINSFHTDPM